MCVFVKHESIDLDVHNMIIEQMRKSRRQSKEWQEMQDKIQRIKKNENKLPKVYMPEIVNGIGYITGHCQTGHKGIMNNQALLVEFIKQDSFMPDEEYIVSVIIDEDFDFDQSWKIFDIPDDSPVSSSVINNILLDIKRKYFIGRI